jgi:hypothetical protein
MALQATAAERYGWRRTASNRFWRIGVPLIVAWSLLFPLVMFLSVLGRRGPESAVDFILSGRFLAYAHPMHLWFLEYLLVLYVLAAVAVVVLPRLLSASARALLIGCFRSTVRSIWAPLPFAILSFLSLLPMNHAALDDPPSFVPAVRIVVAYAIPFAFGWLLFVAADLLDTLRGRAWVNTAMGQWRVPPISGCFSRSPIGAPTSMPRAPCWLSPCGA